jgi:putative tryptophan/tyrosine transport system substrate-binding protein
MSAQFRRRDFITLLGGAAAAWPLAARAQQSAMPIVGLVTIRSADASARNAAAFRKGLNETSIIEGQDVMVEYHWLDGHYDRLPAVMADLVRRHVAVIATPGLTAGAQAAKGATTTIPIVFGVGEDPVKLGLVASLARPGDNATGIHTVSQEVMAKRLGLFHELVPKASRIAVLVNPANQPIAEAMLRDMPEAARAIGLQIQVLKASTSLEIEAADRADGLFVAGDGFFNSRVRDRRAQSHAHGDCREAQQGDQCRSCRSQYEETPHRSGGCGVRGFPRRLWKIHRRRNREVGQETTRRYPIARRERRASSSALPLADQPTSSPASTWSTFLTAARRSRYPI